MSVRLSPSTARRRRQSLQQQAPRLPQRRHRHRHHRRQRPQQHQRRSPAAPRLRLSSRRPELICRNPLACSQGSVLRRRRRRRRQQYRQQHKVLAESAALLRGGVGLVSHAPLVCHEREQSPTPTAVLCLHQKLPRLKIMSCPDSSV